MTFCAGSGFPPRSGTGLFGESVRLSAGDLSASAVVRGGTAEGAKKSIEYYQQATEKDPAYALAYSGLADAYNLLSAFAWLPPREAIPKAKAAALKALEIDDRMAEAHSALGYDSLSYDYDWPAAGRHFERALALYPSSANGFGYSIYLSGLGRHDEALRVAREALALDPIPQ